MEDDNQGTYVRSGPSLREDPWTEAQMRAAAAKLYKPLQRWQTRILRLRPGGRNAALEADLVPAGLGHDEGLILGMDQDVVSYEAISYVWDEDRPGPLRKFRDEEKGRFLWADALCINQSDKLERSVQVVMMFSIYRKAAGVLVWLGKAMDETAALIAALQNGENLHHDQTHGRALAHFASKPWHHRLWVRQEVFAARAVAFHIGGHSFDFETFHQLWRSMKHQGRMLLETMSTGERAATQRIVEPSFIEAAEQVNMCAAAKFYQLEAARHSAALQGREGIARETSGHVDSRPNQVSLEAVLYKHAALVTSNLHDRIFAVLSMTDAPQRTVVSSDTLAQSKIPDWSTILVDYNLTYSQVLQQITRWILNRDRTLALLATCEDRDILRSKKWSNRALLPSWTLSWSVHDRVRPFANSRPRTALKLQTHPLDGSLRLHGFILAEVMVAERASENPEGQVEVMARVESKVNKVKWVSREPRSRDIAAIKVGRPAHSHVYDDSALACSGQTMALVEGLENKQCIWLRHTVNYRFEFVRIESLSQSAPHIFPNAEWVEMQEDDLASSGRFGEQDGGMEITGSGPPMQDLIVW